MAARGYSQDNFQATTAVHKAAANGFSYLSPHTSQSLGYDGYSSLPRMRSGPNRRKVVNSAVQDYLLSLNSMTRSIVMETETVEKEHQCEWTDMNDAKKEEVVDRHFVPEDVRMHYEFERAASCCSFTTSWNSQPHSSGYVVENQPLHLSQPNEWEEWPRCADERESRRQMSRSNNDLVFRNHNMSDAAEDLSLSQPSVYSYNYNNSTTSPTDSQPFNRLHKRQLSLRTSHKVHHSSRVPQAAPPVMMRRGRDSLGSDGEGTRTSDEDFDASRRSHGSGSGVGGMNPLGFQRSRLRSYSMRSRKNGRGGGGNGDSNSNPVRRGSVRLNHRVHRPTSPLPPASNVSSESSRPSHYHSYSNTSTETDIDTDFDAEIDLPIQSLLLDHVYTDSDSTMTSTPPQAVKPNRYSRQRRSLRKHDQKASTIVIHNASSSDDNYTDSVDSFNGVTHSRFADDDKIIHNQNLVRVGSHDSLDSMSTYPESVTSKSVLQSDDDVLSISEQSRMTPDSMLSSASCTSRPKSKMAEMAIMRNRRGNRGGSSYKMVTSDFADRHTQFKSNMLVRKQLDSAQSSTSTTRAPSPTDNLDDDTGLILKPTTLSLPITKYNSVPESFTSDLPRSPDRLSQVSTPPLTPLAIVHMAPSNALKSYDENRESGYLSSSSESFHVAVRR